MTDIPRREEAEQNLKTSYDASDPEVVNNERKKAARLARERLDFVQAVMQQPQGRKYFYDLMKSCDMWGEPLVMGDTHATYRNLGRQSIGKQIFSDIILFDELYVQMMKENHY